MTRRARLHFRAAAFALLMLTPALGFGDTAWLAPSAYTANVDGKIDVSIQHWDSATKYAAVSWPTAARLFIRAGGEQENRHDVAADVAGGQTVAIPLPHMGVSLIGVDFRPVEKKLSSTVLRDKIQQNFSDDARGRVTTPRDGDVRVREVACAATLVRVSDGKSPAEASGVALSKTGQKAEIRPLFDPTVATVGSDLPFRAYVEGSKIEGAIVRARMPDGSIATRTTDATGGVVFRVEQSGPWHIEFECPRAPDDGATTWTIFTGTLTFSVPASGGGQ